MLSPALVIVVLVVLVLLVLFNLLLTLRLAAIVQQREYDRLPLAFPLGAPLPGFVARRQHDGSELTSTSLSGAAAILVFLSPACGDCRRRRVELIELHPAITASGISLWLFGAGSRRRVRAFFEGTPLARHAMSIKPGVRRRLNPRNAAPFYLFVDDAGIVVASGFVGNDDWNSFVAQMREMSGAGLRQIPDGVSVGAVTDATSPAATVSID
ncbi:MAG: hypothetical protein JNM58_15705 [Xanthomonadaceae bacterium]|nr:hypothetical protein [Xanthomonadaceae bacterium]